jgi:5-formyltetrahydrofolate cyclo-ligase
MTSNQCFERYKLRTHYLAERNVLSCSDRAAMSRQIIEKLVTLPVFTKDHFFIYCSYQSEVETLMLLHRCLAKGKSVSVPLTVPQQSELLAIAITDPATELSPGYKGIPEPIPSLAELQRINPQSIDVAIIPGAVFDRAGYRLGYGGGYYDRFLVQKAPQAYRLGLAFSQQLVNRIPALAHDIPMDMLITEKDVFVWPRSGNEKNSCL